MTEQQFYDRVRAMGGDPEMYRSALAGLRRTWTRVSGSPELGSWLLSLEEAGLAESRVVTITRGNGSFAGSYREFRRVGA